MDMMEKQILLLAAGLFCLACAKETAPDDHVSGGCFVLRASLEQDAPDGKTGSGEEERGKTTLDTETGAVLWAEGDKIKAVWNGGSAVSAGLPAGNVTYAEFSFDNMEGTPAYVVYPSTVDGTWDGTDFKVSFPTVQSGMFSEAAIEAGPVDLIGRRIYFKNVGALVKLTIEYADVRTIWIQGAGNTPIAGTALVRFGEDGLPVVASDEVEDGSPSIKVNVSAPGTYYVGVLPFAVKEGIYVELQDGSGNVIGEKITTNTMPLSRREILDLGTLGTGTYSNKYFVSKGGSGTGDGSSWDNACSRADFKTRAADGSLDGKKIFMKEGSYPISKWSFTNALSFEVYGGYPAALTGTSLRGRDIVNCPTTINGGGTYIFTFDHTDLSVKWDGLVITGAGGTSRAGNVITVTAATKVLFTNCTIKDNENSSSSLSGLLAVSGGQNVSFRKCVFSDNTSSSSGCIAKVVSENNLVFKDCTFTGNSSAKNGGLFYVTGGAISFQGCVLADNSAPNGGAAYQDGAGSIVLSECTLSENSATKHGGALYLEAGTLSASACTLSGNSAGYYGGAAYLSGGSLSASNCMFSGNEAKHGSCIAANAVTSAETAVSLSLDNDSFTGNYDITSDEGGLTGALCLNFLSGCLGTVTLDATDCIFSKNLAYTSKISAISDLEGKSVGPACINLGPNDLVSTTSQVSVARLNGCVFNGNMTAMSGGAVRCSQHGSTLYMNRCWFYNNKTYSTASALRSTKGARVAMNNCVFYDNYTKDYSNSGESYPSTLFCNHSPTLMVNTSVLQDAALPAERCLFLGGSAKTTDDAGDSTIFANNILYNHYSYNTSMSCRSVRTHVHQHGEDVYSIYPYGDAYIKSYGHNLYSKDAIEDSAGTYTLTDRGTHPDFYATSRLDGKNDRPVLKWKSAVTIGRPIIFLSSLPTDFPTMDGTYVLVAIEDWDTVNATATKVGQTFGSWLTSLPPVEGNAATAIDCRGKRRNPVFWPGSYQSLDFDPDRDGAE